MEKNPAPVDTVDSFSHDLTVVSYKSAGAGFLPSTVCFGLL